MIRRTLEEICEERGATGKDLKDRIQALRAKVVLPPELFEAMDELRLLGNDAVHIQAKTYDQTSKPELDVAIEFTIELLKALYQYSSLLTKMRGLKKLSP
jgi:predicted transcriptional regulator